MIEVYKYYSKCNQEINAQLLKIIEEHEPNIFDYQVEGYYKSIGEILNHYYVADLIWLHSFKTVKEFSVYKHPIMEKIPEYGEQLFLNITELKENRMKLDEIIVELTNEIETEDLYKTVTRITGSGEKLEKIFWKTLLHVFNHQTHHRGQISQILDKLKIENDYSNMIRH
ncbi:DinB family protein [Pseudobacteroides cellulosolvens]|uniref:DinB family protein n=1 Tax=Pseudobacteroides cellulosolvens ATCC 35603 = DSM 2933 TaxID=398512 RepID=A0A0L6JRH3_9FIRM|nr:DinB family protein [Pseudobacteroides cellulosolvens]KNY28280.1 DinB family protein [Pseudobacteroides cellulosolvens ATCC 35603 = DSM 2933]